MFLKLFDSLSTELMGQRCFREDLDWRLCFGVTLMVDNRFVL